MVRDFSNTTKERLLKQIDQVTVNGDSWSKLKDFIGDAVFYMGKWTKILSINDDMSNIQSYQKKVLDMTDMTKKELKDIFEEVYGIDEEYQSKFAMIKERQSLFNDKIKIMSGMINPNFSVLSAEEIKKQLESINKKLKDYDSKINDIYRDEIDYAAKSSMLKSVKGVGSGLISSAVDLLTIAPKMIKNVVTGNPVGIVSDVWGLINDVFKVGGNLGGLLSGIALIDMSTWSKEYWLTETEKYSGSEGLQSCLDAEGYDKLAKGVKWIDNIDTAISIFDGAKEFFTDGPKELFDTKFGFSKELKVFKKADMTEKYAENWKSYKQLYRSVSKYYNYTEWSNVGKIYGYAESLFSTSDGVEVTPENTAKKFSESFFKPIKWISDGYDLYDDFKDDVLKKIF